MLETTTARLARERARVNILLLAVGGRLECDQNTSVGDGIIGRVLPGVLPKDDLGVCK